MNEEQFNMDIRKFLKQFGVNAQREIERAVWAAIEEGDLAGDETLTARAKLSVDGLDVDLVVEENLRLSATKK